MLLLSAHFLVQLSQLKFVLFACLMGPNIIRPIIISKNDHDTAEADLNVYVFTIKSLNYLELCWDTWDLHDF